LNYTSHLVAFLDILGFSEICLKSENSKEEQNRLKVVFELCSSIPLEFENLSGKAKIKTMVVSDSIILGLELSGPVPTLSELANFFLASGHVQYHLCRNDFWIRGGISIGSLDFDQSQKQAVGPALIRAILLEKQSAKYPRIVVDPLVMTTAGYTTATEFRNEVNAVFASHQQRALFEWEHYFDRLSANRLEQDVPLFIDFARSVPQSSLNDVAESVARGLQGSIVHYKKYRWLADYILATNLQSNMGMYPSPLKTILG
jgi:hypothetical protein